MGAGDVGKVENRKREKGREVRGKLNNKEMQEIE